MLAGSAIHIPLRRKLTMPTKEPPIRIPRMNYSQRFVVCYHSSWSKLSNFASPVQGSRMEKWWNKMKAAGSAVEDGAQKVVNSVSQLVIRKNLLRTSIFSFDVMATTKQAAVPMITSDCTLFLLTSHITCTQGSQALLERPSLSEDTSCCKCCILL